MEFKIGCIIAAHRKKLHLSQKDLANHISQYGFTITSKSVSSWENDNSTPNAPLFLALCKVLNITDIYTEFIGSNSNDPFQKLNASGRQRALEYIDLLSESSRYRKAETAILPFPKRTLPVSLLAASAGTGDFLDEENFESMEVGPEVPANADFGVPINGDSMEPRFHDTQIVWVEKAEVLSSDEIGIFYLDGKTFCKQLKIQRDGVYLISLNSAYQPIKIDEHSSFKIFGRVLE
ncbi:MAG: S24 family peptidase [Lachnospiraceae bacterium]|nr:S24 family peptidase [Lachnospiraceae bacterium]